MVFKETVYTFFNNSCANIPPEYLKGVDGGISSINTTDTCVVLYANTDCQGYMTIVKPATIGHIDLNKVGFDNRALSIGPCDGICTMNNVVERREKAEIIELDMPSEIVAMTSLFCTVGVLTTLCNAALFMLYIRQLRNDKRDGQRHRPLPLLPIQLSKISFENATRSVGPCKSLCRVENVIERIVEQELDSGKLNRLLNSPLPTWDKGDNEKTAAGHEETYSHYENIDTAAETRSIEGSDSQLFVV
ncbi:hypothetical protein PRIPAC_87910 [Pristionchus pacificus]|uniref:Uncharacterized protein n=1 Tax=Pristionchus pacificus TaxID=54126 RepID=A0A2A6CV62_PRIPA|nr:hypothetical protein PRIPAC_87910 [Pristionchus pacificus]|eukprot:PDM82112.1 hypothetical protein PRIPAC_36505 [Pristionchus pacificus]